MSILIVSPHPDDAAFSLAGSLQILRRPISVLTVFGRSNFTLQRMFNNDVFQTTALRRAEDEKFARTVDATLFYWELPEAALRCDPAFECIFADPSRIGGWLTDDRENIGGPLRSALQAATDERKPDAVLLPAGIGFHRDHLVVREIGTEVFRDIGCAIGYYQDLPYAADLSPEQIREWFARLNPNLIRAPLPVEGSIHRDLASIYRSQIDSGLLAKLDSAASTRALWLAGNVGEFLYPPAHR